MSELKELYTASDTSDWDKCLNAARRVFPTVQASVLIEVLLLYVREFADYYYKNAEISNPYLNNGISVNLTKKQIQDIRLNLNN